VAHWFLPVFHLAKGDHWGLSTRRFKTRNVSTDSERLIVIINGSMRIHGVRIKNFRSLRDVTIDFDHVTTFIGPNGTGKSTVLRALDWYFNGSKAGDLNERDCWYDANNQDIEVEVTFADLTEIDRTELGKYAPAGVQTFTAWKKHTPSGDEYLSANAKGLAAFSAIKAASNATDKKDLYKVLRDSQPELVLPVASTGALVENAMTTWESENTDRLEDLPENLQTNFFGFNSGGKMSGLFDYVLVTADMRASEESQDAKSSIIGRILERTIDRTAADDDIGAIVEKGRVALQEVFADKFKTQLDAMTASLNAVVGSYTPGRSILVTPSKIELKIPQTTFDVSVFDGDTETAVERQGHGFQRTLLISALQLLAQSGASAAEGVICLAIEEPELFQHPIQAQAFAKVLRTLAENSTQRVQVTYATHSPYFIEATGFSQVRRLTRAIEERAEVQVHSSNLDTVKNLLAGTTRPAVVDRQLDGTIAARLPIALFSNRVLLVEGATEVAVMSGIADRESIGRLEILGVSVVDVGGKSNLPLAHAILTSLGIPTYAMFDADSGFEDRARKNGKNSVDIDKERMGHIASNRRLLQYFGLALEDFPREQETEDVAILDDQLESLMTRDWPEWSAACSRLEEDAEMVLRKNQSAYRRVTLEADGTPSPLLIRVIDQAIGTRP
jgi:putative ATP-dependent endonuclease of OLD family